MSQLNFDLPFLKTAAVALLSTVLSGCYVEVVHEHEAGNNKDVTYASVSDFRTRFLIDNVLTPYALAAETPYMLIDPEQYTSPRARSLVGNAVVTDTTYSFLRQDVNCDLGGYTTIDAEADTTTYSNGYTYVDLFMRSDSKNCRVMQKATETTINSQLTFDVKGWYDDWRNSVNTLTASVNGSLRLNSNRGQANFTGLTMNMRDSTATSFLISGRANVWLDDRAFATGTTLTTPREVQWTLGSPTPRGGSIRFTDGLDWVEFTFDSQGAWRRQRNGYDSYWTWRELGF